VDVLQPTHLIFILVVALLVLGPKRLPEVGRSLGKGLRDFRGALSGLTDPEEDTSPPEPPSHVTPITPATTSISAEDSPAPPDFPVQPPVTQPPGGEQASSTDEPTGSALLPHVEPDEPMSISPAAGPPDHQD
jgi:sec-independent protein translocase protein TatA